MTLIFLDTETTGLEPDRHQVWEIAYAIDDGDIKSSFVKHSLQGADDKALEINKYHDRGGSRGQVSNSSEFERELQDAFNKETKVFTPDWGVLANDNAIGLTAAPTYTRQVYRDKPATLVGANPHFDANMLYKRWNREQYVGQVWHHRLLDVEAYGMGVMGWDEMKSLSAMCEELGIEPGDHTAAEDVRAVRMVYYRLRDIAKARARSMTVEGPPAAAAEKTGSYWLWDLDGTLLSHAQGPSFTGLVFTAWHHGTASHVTMLGTPVRLELDMLMPVQKYSKYEVRKKQGIVRLKAVDA